MLTWMLYVIAVALVLTAAAFIAEAAARLRGSSTRWIWALAIALSLLIPSVIASVLIQVPNIVSPAVSEPIIELRNVTSSYLAPQALIDRSGVSSTTLQELDPLLKTAWRILSVALLLVLLVSGAQLIWRKRRWTTHAMAGTEVYLTPSVGPAIVGLLRPRIAIPQWLLSFPASQQEAVLRHERSHLAAGDTQLLTAALFLLVFMPWNVPLWWQLRRLRHAIEVDCDRRVLNSGCDSAEYSETLLAVGERQSRYLGAVAAMSESTSFLEERITLMLKPSRPWHRALAIGLLGLSATMVGVAAQVSPPNAQTASRQEIALDAAVLDRYVGVYQMSESAFLTVTREGSQLSAQLTGQPAFPIFAQSATAFFYKVVDAQVDFQVDANNQTNSLTLRQNGQTIPMPKVDAALARQAAANTAAKIQGQTATPGSEAALRRLIAQIAAGQPDYGTMMPALAEATRKQLPTMQAAISGYGAVQSVEFRGVGNMGWDIYAVKQEKGTLQWSIALAADGKIEGALVVAAP